MTPDLKLKIIIDRSGGKEDLSIEIVPNHGPLKEEIRHHYLAGSIQLPEDQERGEYEISIDSSSVSSRSGLVFTGDTLDAIRVGANHAFQAVRHTLNLIRGIDITREVKRLARMIIDQPGLATRMGEIPFMLGSELPKIVHDDIQERLDSLCDDPTCKCQGIGGKLRQQQRQHFLYARYLMPKKPLAFIVSDDDFDLAQDHPLRQWAIDRLLACVRIEVSSEVPKLVAEMDDQLEMSVVENEQHQIELSRQVQEARETLRAFEKFERDQGEVANAVVFCQARRLATAAKILRRTFEGSDQQLEARMANQIVSRAEMDACDTRMSS